MSLLFYFAEVAEAAETQVESDVIWVLVLVTSLLAVFHLVSHPLYKLFDNAEHIVHAFGGGLAISYVFIHLLPELEEAGEAFGRSIYIITLGGFIVFYGMQSLLLKGSGEGEPNDKLISRIFLIEMFFAGIYNALIIYTLPGHFHGLFILVLVYLVTMGLHLLGRNYGLYKKHGDSFKVLGSVILAISLFLGLAMNLFLDPSIDEILTDVMTAFLTGFILFNVFVEELPSPKASTFFWFLGGIVSYLILLEIGA